MYIIACAFTSDPDGCSSQSTTYAASLMIDAAQHRLPFPGELMVLPDGRQVAFIENLNLIPAIRVPWLDDE